MFYYLRKKRLSSGETQYYLYKIIYLGNGRKKWIPIASCEEIEKIVNFYKQQIGQKREIGSRRSSAVHHQFLHRGNGGSANQCNHDGGSPSDGDGGFGCTGSVLPLPSESEFREWMMRKGFMETTVVDKIRYLRRIRGFCGDLVSPKDVLRMPWNSHFKQTMRYVIEYLFEMGVLRLEDYVRWRSLITRRAREKAERKMRKRGAKPVSDEEIIHALRRLWETRSKYYGVALLLTYSGARGSEIVKMLNEYDPGRWEIHGEVALYTMMWVRGYKFCEYIFLPREAIMLVEDMQREKPYIKHSLEIKYPVSKFRDYFYQKWKDLKLGEKEAAYIQSRELPTSEEHYDKIKERAIQQYPKWIQWLKENILSKIT